MSTPSSTMGDTFTAKSRLAADLLPVVAWLAANAHQRAGEILAEADAEADATIADARRQGDAVLAAARESGAADSRRLALAVVADERREAREEVLGAQRRIYEQARALARHGLCDLVGSPGASALRERLVEVARQRLGGDVTVTTSEGEFGVIARRGARSLDFSTDALLEAAMASMGAAIAELWR